MDKKASPALASTSPHVVPFLEDIKDHAEDDTPRLLLADWLDDQGCYERAELIRLQCSLARARENDPRTPEWHQRTQEILEQHESTWVGPLREVALSWEFRRGLLHLSVKGADLVGDPMARLMQEPEANWVEGLECYLTVSAINRLTLRPFLNKLTTLRLRTRELWGTARAAHLVANCPHLHRLVTLDFSDTNIREDGATALARSPHLARLTTLRLGHDLIGDRGVIALAGSRYLTRLNTLDLTDNRLEARGIEALAHAPGMGWLTSLELAQNWRLGAAAAVSLKNSPHLSELVTLGLQGTQIGDEGAEALAQAPFTRLTHLDLSECWIEDRGVEALANSPILKPVTHLNLARNHEITQAGARALARAPVLDQVNQLDLRGLVNLDHESHRLLRERFGPRVLLSPL